MTERTIRTIIEGQELLTAAASMPVSIAAQHMQRRRVGAVMTASPRSLHPDRPFTDALRQYASHA